MKVKIQQTDLAFTLNMVLRAINPTNTLPILGNILISVTKEEITLIATNLEIAVKLTIKGTIEEEGSLTVPAKLISSYVGLLPNEELEISSTEDLSLEIISKKSNTKIKGLKSDDYPTIPQIEEVDFFEIPSMHFEKAIQETVFASSLNTSRPILSGVYLKAEGQDLTLAATDSYRLAEKKLKLIAPYKEKVECIIPARTLQELSKILTNFPKESVKVVVSKNQILFKISNVRLTSRLIEGNFPDYTKIIPNTSKTQIKLNGSDLNQALKRVSLFARELNNSIHLEANPEEKKVFISTEETRIGEEKTQLEVEITGEMNKISLNSQYMLDVLSVKEGEKIVVEINEKLSPIKIRPEKSEDYVYIIMPLKV